VLIIAAIGLLALLGFVAFASDYGVFWAARGQSQSAADMSAMAAATSWAFDVPDADAVDATQALKDQRALYARESAVEIAQRNLIWGATPAIDKDTDVLVPPGNTCPGGTPAVDCVRVNLYRDAAHGNALPVYFAHLFGVVSQDMKATATAGVVLAGASDCLTPLALPDRWIEYDKDGKVKDFKQKDSKFEKYDWDDKTSSPKLRPFPDVYVVPGSTGTGYKFTDSASVKEFNVDDLTLKVDKNDAIKVKEFVEKEPIKANRYLALEIPRKDGTSSYEGYSANFASCAGQAVRIGDYVSIFNNNKNEDLNQLYTKPAVKALIDTDPGAKYKDGKITGSCAQTCSCTPGDGWDKCGKHGVSPRVVNMPLYDPDQWTDCVVGKIVCDSNKTVRVVNIVGFFVDQKKEKELDKGKFKGSHMPALGQIVAWPPIDNDISILRAIAIVR
jgi:hypothetical protein